MTEQLLWQLCSEQVQFFGTLVESRRPDERDERFVEDVGEIISAIARLSASLRHVQEVTLKAALEGRIKAIQGAGEAVNEVLRASVRLSEVLQTRCRKAIESGHRIETLHDLDRAANDLRAMRDDWARRWPFVDHVMLDRTATEYSEGKHQSAKDALHELRNHHS